jgi:uncharacterized protein with PhoU and TrkA domain
LTKRKRRGALVEEIEYEPISVRELLTQMKDKSELIVDLAYSAMIFNSPEIGKKVHEIESEMDTLMYRIRMQTMLATRTVEDGKQFAGILQIASAAEEISNAAGDMVDLLERSVETRPFLPFMLQEGDEKIEAVWLDQKSCIAGKTISELAIETELGVRVIAVKRGKRWIYSPDSRTTLVAKDIVICRGVIEGMDYLRQCAKGSREWGEWE